MNDFRNGRFILDTDEIVPRDVRDRYADLPETAIIRDREIDIEYDVEEKDGEMTGVARLRLPEKLAKNVTEAELPRLDRPLRFVVIRGQRGAIRADSLSELQDALDQPWSPDEVEEAPDAREYESRLEKRARDLAGRKRKHRGRRNENDQRRGGRKRRFRPR